MTRNGPVDGTPGAVAPAGPRKTSETLGVVLVDGPQVIRAALGMLMAAESDMEVLLEASSAEDCLAQIRGLRRRSPIIAVVGLSLDGEHDSFWLIRSIRETFPTMPIIATGWGVDDTAISRALFVGADSFVDKNADPSEFIDAIRRTGHGEVVLAGLPDNWLGKIAEGLPEKPEERVLTRREIEVLEVASQGYTARQIGSRLGLRERTVTTHLGRIYRKLGAGSRVQAIAEATRSGLVPPNRRR